MDHGIPLRKELAMPNLHDSAAREAVGTAPKSFPGMKDKKVETGNKRSAEYCEVKHQK